MADFDQLLRDKANQAQYEYKRSAWRNFAKQAGIKTGPSAITVAAISVGAVAVAGAILWGVLARPAAPVAQDPAPIVVALDTLPETCPPAETTQQPSTPIPVPTPASTRKSAAAATAKSNITPTVDTVMPQAEQPKTPAKKKVTRQPYLRPVTISADTITQMVPTDEQIRNGNSRIF